MRSLKTIMKCEHKSYFIRFYNSICILVKNCFVLSFVTVTQSKAFPQCSKTNVVMYPTVYSLTLYNVKDQRSTYNCGMFGYFTCFSPDEPCGFSHQSVAHTEVFPDTASPRHPGKCSRFEKTHTKRAWLIQLLR